MTSRKDERGHSPVRKSKLPSQTYIAYRAHRPQSAPANGNPAPAIKPKSRPSTALAKERRGFDGEAESRPNGNKKLGFKEDRLGDTSVSRPSSTVSFAFPVSAGATLEEEQEKDWLQGRGFLASTSFKDEPDFEGDDKEDNEVGIAVIEEFLGEKIASFLGETSIDKLRRKLFKVLWSLYRERKSHSKTSQRLSWAGEQLQALQHQGSGLVERLRAAEDAGEAERRALEIRLTEERDSTQRLLDHTRAELKKTKLRLERAEAASAAAELKAKAQKELADTSLKSSSSSEKVAAMWESKLRAVQTEADNRLAESENQQAVLREKVGVLERQLRGEAPREVPSPSYQDGPAPSPTVPRPPSALTPVPPSTPPPQHTPPARPASAPAHHSPATSAFSRNQYLTTTSRQAQGGEVGSFQYESELQMWQRRFGFGAEVVDLGQVLEEALRKNDAAEKKMAIMGGQLQILRHDMERYKQMSQDSKEAQRSQRSAYSKRPWQIPDNYDHVTIAEDADYDDLDHVVVLRSSPPRSHPQRPATAGDRPHSAFARGGATTSPSRAASVGPAGRAEECGEELGLGIDSPFSAPQADKPRQTWGIKLSPRAMEDPEEEGEPHMVYLPPSRPATATRRKYSSPNTHSGRPQTAHR